jgi:Cu-Zn family superoxide dismutase
MKTLFAGLLTLLVSVAASAAPPRTPNAGPQHAVAVLHATGHGKVQGTLWFTQEGNHVEIIGEITGLTPGLHAFHIHEFGDCSAPDAMSAGGHYNPTGMKHGSPDHGERHVGDLGNIRADENGKATIDIKDALVQLHGPHSIIGRAVIVHADPDDFKSQPAGNAGARIACGVVGITKSKTDSAK